MDTSSRLPVVSFKELSKALERFGFVPSRQKGSHVQFQKATNRKVRVTVPNSSKKLKKGTLANIISQAGLTRREFLDLLYA